MISRTLGLADLDEIEVKNASIDTPSQARLKLWTDNWARLLIALHLLAPVSAAHITVTTCIYTHIHHLQMFSEVFSPMAPADSVPRVVRNYHYEHFPPPSDSVELTAELHRELRAVPHGGFWGKVKSAGWRLLRE